VTQTVPPHRSRGLRALLIALLVLVVLFVVADRVGVAVAERVAGDTIQSSQHLDSRPEVDVAGFPFLTQLATGNFDKITVTAHDIPVGQQVHLLNLSRIRATLHGVHVSRDFSSVHANTADAVALVGYRELGKTLGIDVEPAGNGRIKAAKRITILGQSIQASITTEPQIVNGALAFGAPTINGLGDLAQNVTDALKKVFDLTVPLQGIPFDIKVQSLQVGPDGLAILLTGNDLSYSK